MSAFPFRVAEYFAGIGLAKAGLETADLQVVWSNDLSAKKARMFAQLFPESNSEHYLVDDLRNLKRDQVPTDIDLAWASFPCTDLSLAGGRGGIHSGGSAAFWAFISQLARMGKKRPALLAIENVAGLNSSKDGADLRRAVVALNQLGYVVDAVMIDARHFVPQSRPRVFLVCDRSAAPSRAEEDSTPAGRSIRPAALDAFYSLSDVRTRRRPLPALPPLLTEGFSELIKQTASDQAWWSTERIEAFVSSLSTHQAGRIRQLTASDERVYRTAYRRMRAGVPRWEVRPDDIAGCLRTASGGSSRQAVVELGGGTLRVRWMTEGEYGRLMGVDLPTSVNLPTNQVLSGFGDAVCVPAVAWLARNYLRPRLQEIRDFASTDLDVLAS